MREILFRGKCKTDNEWLYGFPYVTRKNAVKINWYCSEFGSMRTDEVDPETVEQYTGLTDKNGVRIFEGDIVDYISSDVIGNPKTGTIIVEDMTDYDTMIYLNHSEELQIIGNIHDNPELLNNPSL